MQNMDVLASIVRIHAYSTTRDFAQPFRLMERGMGVGTGFFIEGPDATKLYVLTCAHVVEKADDVFILFPLRDSEEVQASVVAVMPNEYDLALLVIDDAQGTHRAHAKPMQLGSSSKLQLGQKLTAYGYPLGQTALKVSDGVYAGYQQLLQHTVSISPGNSGGPLVDEHHKVVGVNNSGITDPEASNVGYAIPIEFFQIQSTRFFNNLARLPAVLPLGPSGKQATVAPSPAAVLRMPTFGFYYQESTPAQTAMVTNQPDLHGVYVYQVLENTPAWNAGLRAGDILMQFDNAVISNRAEVSVPWNYQKVKLEDVLRRATQEETAYPVKFFSAAQRQEVSTSMQPRVLQVHGFKMLYPPYDPVLYVPFMGVTLMELCRNHMYTPETMRTYLSLEPEQLVQPIVIVTHLFSGMKARNSNTLLPGDIVTTINGRRVTTLDEVRAALGAPVNGRLEMVSAKGRALVLPVAEVVEAEKKMARLEPLVYKPETALIEALGAQ